MRLLFINLAFATTALISNMAMATNIAVADSQQAVLASNLAKQTIISLQTSLKPQKDHLDQLKIDLNGLDDQFKKNGSVMSDKDKQALQAQAQSKMNDYNSTAEGIQKRVEETETTMLKTLMPKLEGVIESLRKEGNYDVIVEKKYVIWSSSSADLTQKITDRLNAEK